MNKTVEIIVKSALAPNLEVGQIVELPAARARNLIRAGHARPATKQPKVRPRKRVNKPALPAPDLEDGASSPWPPSQI